MGLHAKSLQDALALADSGEYAAALAILNEARVEPSAKAAADVLRAELLERTGRHGQAVAILEPLLRHKSLAKEHRSAGELVLARIDLEHGKYDSASNRLRVAASLANECNDLRRKSWAWVILLLRFQRVSTGEASSPLIADLRDCVTRLGDPVLWAALHMCVAQSDAQRGLLQSARRHTRMARELLAKKPHLWLETLIETTEFAIAFLESDLRKAVAHARRAVTLAEQSGAAASLRTTLGNLGLGLYGLGNFDEALSSLRRSHGVMPLLGVDGSGPLDTIAKIHLAQGNMTDCATVLNEINAALASSSDRHYYPNRHNVITRSEFLAFDGRIDEALSEAERALTLARETRDHLLTNLALLRKADLLQMCGRRAEAATALDVLNETLFGQPTDLFAQSERIIAATLARVGEIELGKHHFDRAARSHDATGNVPGRIELERSWSAATESTAPEVHTTVSPHPSRNHLLHDTAALLLYAGRPELIARELVHLLEASRSAHRAYAERHTPDGRTELLSQFEDGSPVGEPDERQIVIGLDGDRAFDIRYVPKADAESLATINCIKQIVAAVQELQRARIERENRLTLWPVEDEPAAEDGFILLGRMRELMTLAKRVAKAHVTVLITGESGTGKEVLARAVHKYSDRAAKPFVPFNCAAIPRDLVESHLFGHRRGSFTGADRDNPGIIRAARGGTIFLDEVGELSLDLQPKLLRFLESGEIAPLGEGVPTTVDVRVVAATNAKLETAVSEGRFREDLFYRLNVVRLDIPPLRERRDEIATLVNHFVAAMAHEFKKGHLRLAEETMEHFLVHRWPGNVRQVQNEVRRIVALAEPDSVIPPSVLAPEILNRHLLAQPITAAGEMAVPVRDKLMPTLSRIEREMIKAALRDHGGRVEAAARALGISRKGLYLKRQRLGL